MEGAEVADWVQQMKDAAQPHVPEPVVAVGILQPAGSWGAMGFGQVSGLAGMIARKAANDRSGGLGKNGAFSTKAAMLALTADRVYAFNVKPRGRTFKVVSEVGDWARDDLKVETAKGKLSTKVVLDVVSTGDHFELEATTIMQMGGFTDVFLAELTGTSGSPGSSGTPGAPGALGEPDA
jgi:hypothetical protein